MARITEAFTRARVAAAQAKPSSESEESAPPTTAWRETTTPPPLPIGSFSRESAMSSFEADARRRWSIRVLGNHQVFDQQRMSWDEGLGGARSAPVKSSVPIAVPKPAAPSPSDEGFRFGSMRDDILVRNNSPSFMHGVFDLFSPPSTVPSTSLRSSIIIDDSEFINLKYTEFEPTRVDPVPEEPRHKPAQDQQQQEDYVPITRKLFVGKIPKGSVHDEVLEFFSAFGEVECVDVNADRGCSFVTFSQVSYVESLLQGNNARYLDFKGAEICCRRYVVIEKDKLFVRGLAMDATKDDLFNYFRQFGRIEHVTLHKNKTGASPFAFVRFANKKSVNQIMARNDHTLGGKALHCLRAHRQDGTMESRAEDGAYPEPL